MPDSETAEGEAPTAMTANEQCVPAAALAVDGTPPTVGDDVEYTVRGKIARVEGGNAYVAAETINSEPMPAATTEPDGDEDPMAAAMRADAEG